MIGIKNMDMESKYEKMGQFITEIEKKEKFLEKEDLFIQMEMFMKEDGKIIKSVDMEF